MTESVGSNSIPTKVLKLLKNKISSQFFKIFKISFSSGVFPLILKNSKVISVHKKESELELSNYIFSIQYLKSFRKVNV